MTTNTEQKEGTVENVEENPEDELLAGSVGRVDWNPLCKLTGVRPHVSKYGLPRYSPMEWRQANDDLLREIPNANSLKRETKNIIAQTSWACDKEQSENTLKLRQRAVDVTAQHVTVCQYCKDLKNEISQMALYKLRIRRALEMLGIVEGINAECREIRKNRFAEDLVRDEVEEELFREKGLCEEIRLVYTATLNEFDSQYRIIKNCYQELHSIWSDQRETLNYEAENIGLKSSSEQISFHHGIARFDEKMSSLELWEGYMGRILPKIQETIESSKAFRLRVHSSVLVESAKDLKNQDEKVLKALLKRIDEEGSARKLFENELDKVLSDIAHTEGLYRNLEKLGRQVDFNLKVVQTRLENRRHRPGVENCRDKPQIGLIQELKVINERVTAVQGQMKKISDTLDQLYSSRKKLERQIHVKRHSLSLDQERCLLYRSKFPNAAYLKGY